MKHYSTILWISIICFTVSCGGNKLKTDERALSKQILTEEEQLAREEAVRAEKEKQLADSIARLPKGFRFKEDRKVDPNNPPVIIDFTKEPPSQEIKLSEIGHKITYIKLSIPNDSLYFSSGMGGEVSFTRDNIILNNNFGVHRFSRGGKYIEAIANSNIEKSHKNGQAAFGYFEKENYRGVWANHVSVAGNRVFYKFSDYPSEKVSLLNYDLKSGEQTVSFKAGEEGKGDHSFTKGAIVTSGKEAVLSGTPGLSSTYIYGISSDFYAGVNSHLDANGTGLMLATFNLAGDTLCKFTQFDKFETPITSNIIRTVSSILEWQYKGQFTFMKSFNDTIFRLLPPNRIVPAYVFNFGTNKITDEAWYHFNNKLDGKYMVESILENDQLIFIEYIYFITNESREIRYALFDKRNKKLIGLKFKNKINDGPTKMSNCIGLKNDLDNGLSFLPAFVTPEGNFGRPLTPSMLKDWVQKRSFDSRSEQSKKLKMLTESLGNDTNERIVMIVE